MDFKEAKRWIIVFLVAVIACGIYYYQKESSENKVFTEQNKVSTQQPQDTNVAFGITKSMKGQTVTVQATIVSYSSGKGHLFPILKDQRTQKTIKGVLFKQDSAENAEQKRLIEEKRKDGTLVTIEGEVDVYNDELEIIIKKVY